MAEGKGLDIIKLVIVFSSGGHCSLAPMGVADQSSERTSSVVMSSPISQSEDISNLLSSADMDGDSGGESRPTERSGFFKLFTFLIWSGNCILILRILVCIYQVNSHLGLLQNLSSRVDFKVGRVIRGDLTRPKILTTDRVSNHNYCSDTGNIAFDMAEHY